VSWSTGGDQLPPDASERLAFLARFAVLAPSSYNTQPWLFEVGRSTIALRVDESRWLRVGDPDQRELYVGLGCALENLLVAAEHFDFDHKVDLEAGGAGAVAARVTLGAGRRPSFFRGPELFYAIAHRRTYHRPLSTRTVPEHALERLRECVVEPGLVLDLTEDPEIRREVHRLGAEAEAQQFANPAFRDELGHWIGEGAFGTPWPLSRAGELAVARLNMKLPAIRPPAQALRTAPFLGLISSRDEDHVSQVRVGQLLERLCLTATHLGLSIQPMSCVVQVGATRERLRALLGGGEGLPQQAFRVGYADSVPRQAPRRPLAEVLRIAGEGPGA
jgi:nitroreductase